MNIPVSVQKLTQYLGHVTKADVALIVVVIVSSLLFLLQTRFIRTRGSVVEISVSGTILTEHNLDQDAIIDVKGPLGTTVVQVADHRVRILSSPCKEKICVHTGPVDAHGGILICIPNEVAVRITGGENQTLDALTR